MPNTQRDYSITFYKIGDKNTRYNTKDTWSLIPDSPPMVPPPERITNYLEIPGRVEGPLDLSDISSSYRTYYSRVTGSWTFYRDISEDAGLIIPTRESLFAGMRYALHGRRMKIVLPGDTDTYYYLGRLSVGLPTGTRNPLTITIGYDLDPLRYKESDGTVDIEYMKSLNSLK